MSSRKPTTDDAAALASRLARIVLLDQSRCQPNSPAFDYLRKQAGLGCPEARKPPCLQMREMRCVVLEDACPACLNRAKRCPNDAVRVVNLPHSLAPALTHRYGPNTFKLHKLPIPRPSQVLGLVGTNGIGKSTALKLLAGQVRPNLGRVDDPADWSDVLAYFKGSELHGFFSKLLDDGLKAVAARMGTEITSPAAADAPATSSRLAAVASRATMLLANARNGTGAFSANAAG